MVLRIPCRRSLGGYLLTLQATDAGTARAEDGGFIVQSAERMGQNQAGRIQLSFSQQKTWLLISALKWARLVLLGFFFLRSLKNGWERERVSFSFCVAAYFQGGAILVGFVWMVKGSVCFLGVRSWWVGTARKEAKKLFCSWNIKMVFTCLVELNCIMGNLRAPFLPPNATPPPPGKKAIRPYKGVISHHSLLIICLIRP